MLERFLKPRPAVAAGRVLFKAVAAQARRPGFYSRWGVPDTVEGRFELYVAHLVLVLHRLKGCGVQASETAQGTFDAFLRNLDEGLRDMGVGDLSVGKKMRKLGEAVYGRIRSYDQAFARTPMQPELEGLVRRTVFQDIAEADPAPLARYLATAVDTLAAQPLDAVMGAQLVWPEVEHD